MKRSMTLRLLGIGLAGCCALPSLAQIVVPTPVLQAPVAVSPTAGLQVYDFNTPATTFTWNQHPFFSSPWNALPNHFLVCYRRITEGACGHATASFNLLPGTVPSSILRAPATQSIIGTQYRFTPTLPADRLDVPVRWTIAGCTNNSDASCQFTPGTWITLATMDLKAANISANVFGATYSVTGQALNKGSRDSRASTMKIESWEVILDPVAQDCLRNPNDPSVRNETTLFVINRKGVLTRFSALPRDAAGNYVVANVIGIYRTAPATAGQLSPSPTAVGVLDLSVPLVTRPRAFAHKLTTDFMGQIDEPDEADNTLAECEAVL